ncbi:hypothetical protein [Chitinophaga fulva]|nr:hypothetical protein [Chitinophaga fulva]
MGIVITGFGMDATFRKELPDHYRIQLSAKSPMVRGDVEIIKTYVVAERLEGSVSYIEMRDNIGTAKLEDVQSVQVVQSWRDSSRIALQFPDTTVQYTFFKK